MRGFEFFHQPIEFGFQFDKAFGEGGFGVEADDTGRVDEFGLERPKIDDTVAGDDQAGIDAEDSHKFPAD